MGVFQRILMSLEDEIKHVLVDFENTPSEKIFEILTQIKPQFKNELISEYLQGKIQKISDVNDVVEKKKQCKALIPYFDWFSFLMYFVVSTAWKPLAVETELR